MSLHKLTGVRLDVLSNATGLVVSTTIQFASVPVLLAALGVARYGYWLLLLAVPTYLTFADLGFASASSTECTRLWATGECGAARRLFGATGVLVLGVSGTLAIALAWVVLWKREVVAAFGIRPSFETSTAVILLVIFVVGLLLTQVLEGGYRSSGDFPLGVLMITLIRVADFIAIATAAHLSGSFVTMAIAAVCTRWVGIVGAGIVLDRRSKMLAMPRRHDFTALRRLLAPSVGFLAFPIGNAINGQGMLILAGDIVGPALVVKLSIARTVSNAIRQLTNAIQYGALPALTMAIAQRQRERAERILRRCAAVLLPVTAMSALLITLVGPAAVRIWTHERVRLGSFELGSIAGTTLLDVPWLVLSLTPIALNRHARLGTWYLLGSLCSLATARALIGATGIVGVAIGLTVMDLFVYGPSWRGTKSGLGDIRWAQP